MKAPHGKILFLTLLTAWLVINMIQASFTEILSDEAYYRLFGLHLAWGYFDHPPLVALMTKISSMFFDGVLGVRFATVLLHSATLILIWKITGFKVSDAVNVTTFFAIAGSVVIFQAFGFITTPDAPLLFFTALFLYSYKNFINDRRWSYTLLLSLSMAGLLYSKYQAFLVIGLVTLADLRLLKDLRFWSAGIIALLLLSPHIWWQFNNDFPAFRYHLVDRSDSFRWQYFLEYLPNQIAVFNPLTLGAVIYLLVRYRPADQFIKSLYFQVTGFLVFFWLISFRGHVEPQWTTACTVPVIILLSERSTTDPGLARFVRRFILPSVLLILAVRFFLMTDTEITRKLRFSGKEERYRYIESVAGGLPVVFRGSYQDPSLYSFFTGREATALSYLYTRRTQYDLWQLEKQYQNEPVFVFGRIKGRSQIHRSGRFEVPGFSTDSLQTVNRMQVAFSLGETRLSSGEKISVPFSMKNTYDYYIDFNHSEFPVSVCMVFINRNETRIVVAELDSPIGTIEAGATIERTLTVTIPNDLGKGKYKCGICLSTVIGPVLTSNINRTEISDDN